MCRVFSPWRRAPWLGETSGFRSGRRIGGGAVYSSVSEQGVKDGCERQNDRKIINCCASRRLRICPTIRSDWFLSQTLGGTAESGRYLLAPGRSREFMVVILDGAPSGPRRNQWRNHYPSLKPGDVTGVLPFSRMKKSRIDRAGCHRQSRILRFPSSLFPELIQKMPELTQRLVGLMSDRIRETTRMEQQRDRLAGLGKLSAGLAHELNNPASAAKRATGQLREILKRIRMPVTN